MNGRFSPVVDDNWIVCGAGGIGESPTPEKFNVLGATTNDCAFSALAVDK
jgi:hypothetical protein